MNLSMLLLFLCFLSRCFSDSFVEILIPSQPEVIVMKIIDSKSIKNFDNYIDVPEKFKDGGVSETKKIGIGDYIEINDFTLKEAYCFSLKIKTSKVVSWTEYKMKNGLVKIPEIKNSEISSISVLATPNQWINLVDLITQKGASDKGLFEYLSWKVRVINK